MFRNELQKDFTNAKDSYADLVFVSEVDGKDVEHKNVITTDVEMFLYNENYLKWNKKEGKMESALTLDPAELKTWTETKAINTVYESKVPNDIAEIVQYWGTATELFDSITNQEMQEYFKDKVRKYNNISGIKFANRTQAVTLPSGRPISLRNTKTAKRELMLKKDSTKCFPSPSTKLTPRQYGISRSASRQCITTPTRRTFRRSTTNPTSALNIPAQTS